MQLVINAGSSSLKWALFPAPDEERIILEGVFDGFGDACVLRVGESEQHAAVKDHSEAVAFLLRLLGNNPHFATARIDSVVHRVVHGGEHFSEPTLITASVREQIESLSLLAPLHNPANIAGIDACADALSGIAQVAVFDTAFHHTIPREVFLYGLPVQLYKRFGIRKYGFHGISHGYVASVLEERYGEPVDAISCHLGNGSSVTALRAGKSVDTSMGFTPLDGVIMGTRSGDLDPEIPLFLMREGHYTQEEVEDLLNNRSGLVGIAGEWDVRIIWSRARRGDTQCRLALDMLSYRVAWFVSAMRASVPRPRALVFTGGIGEGAWYIREHVMRILQAPVDSEANRAHERLISSPDSPFDVLVVAADEQLHMHRLARKVLHKQ